MQSIRVQQKLADFTIEIERRDFFLRNQFARIKSLKETVSQKLNKSNFESFMKKTNRLKKMDEFDEML